MVLLENKCAFIVGDSGAGKTKLMCSKIKKIKNEERLFVFTKFENEYEDTLSEKYGNKNFQTINVNYKKKIDLFSFHYPNKVINFEEYFNLYVDNLVDFLSSSFGIHQDETSALRNVIINLFGSRNITNFKRT